MSKTSCCSSVNADKRGGSRVVARVVEGDNSGGAREAGNLRKRIAQARAVGPGLAKRRGEYAHGIESLGLADAGFGSKALTVTLREGLMRRRLVVRCLGSPDPSIIAIAGPAARLA